MLEEIKNGTFEMLGPHGVLTETALLIDKLDVSSRLTSDHYTNYVTLEGRLDRDKKELLKTIERYLKQEETSFRPFYVGTQ